MAVTIPMLMAAGPAIGYFLGSFLDGYFGTEPYLMILTIILGFGASFMETRNLIKRTTQENSDE
ncbi:MAG: hypothetical protein GF307_05770 [candidate division Zixibacteria bacterium]|nr:hypothetical protein [candidate division Zixibacteria bacterium]